MDSATHSLAHLAQLVFDLPVIEVPGVAEPRPKPARLVRIEDLKQPREVGIIVMWVGVDVW